VIWRGWGTAKCYSCRSHRDWPEDAIRGYNPIEWQILNFQALAKSIVSFPFCTLLHLRLSQQLPTSVGNNKSLGNNANMPAKDMMVYECIFYLLLNMWNKDKLNMRYFLLFAGTTTNKIWYVKICYFWLKCPWKSAFT